MWLGVDSYIGHDGSRDLTDRPKFCRRGDLWLAWAGDLSVAQAVLAGPSWRGRRKSEDPADYLARAVAPAMRAAWATVPKAESVDLLVVVAARVYQMAFDGSVHRSARGVAASGAGQDYALGALSALAHEPPEKRVRAALSAAAEWCPHVARPFHVTHVP